MNQESAILQYNKYKFLKNEYVTDALTGLNYKIIKVRLVKISDSDFNVILHIKSDMNQSEKEVDSIYANHNFRVIKL